MNTAPLSPLRLLVVEDDAGLAALLTSLFQELGFVCASAQSGREAIDSVAANTWDLALLDYGLPDMRAEEIVASARAAGKMPPFIILTGQGDERVAVELMKLGARDYLIKDASLLCRLPGVVSRVLEETKVRCQLEEAELALKRSEAELNATHEHAPVAMLLLDGDCRIRRANKAALAFAECPAGQSECLTPGSFIGCLGAIESPKGCGHGSDCSQCVFRLTLLSTLQSGKSHHRVEVRPKLVRGRAVQQMTLLVSTAQVVVGKQPMVLICIEDITEQKRLEEQLRHAQKMEAVGQLAGGIAHDFNNILTGILMQLGLMQTDSAVPEAMIEPLKDLESQAHRAANLTRQLLMFSRRQVMRTQVLDLNHVVDEMTKMLGRLLGENVAVEFHPQNDLPPIKADPGMIEQVLMNLSVNARDAMPKGGRLTLATDRVTLSESACAQNLETRPGDFVRLTVTDTGCGMDKSIMSHIFEPFFTTKEVGKGTGLGLATAFGIVKQHDGWIEVRSIPNYGSSFLVYLPVLKPAAAGNASEVASPVEKPPLGGDENILLVEDEPNVRSLIALVLRRKGYRVVEATNAIEARQQWTQFPEVFDLLFSDVVMPEGVSGLELAQQLRHDCPQLKVILCSGYSPDLNHGGGIADSDIIYLPKPTHPDLLARTVRDCLDLKKKAG